MVKNFMKEYILFLDESKVTAQNPYFCLGGFISPRDYYENVIVKGVEDLKAKHNIKHETSLHYTDIKNSKGEFINFKTDSGNKLRMSLMNDIVKFISSLDIVTIGNYCNKKAMNKLIGSYVKFDVYTTLLHEILNQYLVYLLENGGHGSIYIESRTFNEDSVLQKEFYRYKEHGSVLFNSDIIQKYLKTITFCMKKDVCNGLEIADFIPVSFIRYINKGKDNYELSAAVLSKLYKNGTIYKEAVGLKNLYIFDK